MLSRFKQLGKDSLIYGFGGIVAKSIGFFLLPIYTRIFSPAEYGTIEMLVVLSSFLGSIIVMGMDAAQSFYFFEQKRYGQNAQARVVTAILQWRISWGSLILVTAILFSPPLNRFFFNGQLSWNYFAISFGAVFGVQIMSQSAEVFRLLYRPFNYISITLGQTLLSAAVGLTLILGFGWGILGFFWGSLIGALAAAFWGWWRIREYLDGTGWHKDWWPRLVRFGAPFVPEAFAMYVLNTADRWFVIHYRGQEALGLYAIGAKFAMLIFMAVATFRLAWWPVAMEAMHHEDGPALYRIIGRLYLGGGAAAVVLLTALSPYLVRGLTTPAFAPAYPLVGILAWYSIFYGFYTIGAAGIWKAEKTIWVPFLMGAAALLNVGLDSWLVPRYGGMGAAVATSISFGVWNLLALIVSERYWPVGYAYPIMGIQVGMGIIACALILYLYHQEAASWSIWSVTLVTVFILLSLSVTREHFRKLLTMVRRK